MPGKCIKDMLSNLSLSPYQLVFIGMCSLLSYGLILINPGLYWDDWVWIFNAPEVRIQTSRELGNFWGGYVSNALYSLNQSVFVLRGMAFSAWLAAACACAVSLGKVLKLARIDIFFIAVAFALFPIADIRYISSLTFYNIYIASFYIGVYLLLSTLERQSLVKTTIACCLFFFSFYLNSLILCYAMPLAYAFWHDVKAQNKPTEKNKRHFLLALFNIILHRIYYILLPIFFISVKSFFSVQSTFYANYNSVSFGNIISGISFLWLFFSNFLFDFTRQFIACGLLANAVIFALTIVGGIFGATRHRGQPMSPYSALATLLIGLSLCLVAIFPYVCVGKIPLMLNFYESRHYILTPPGLALVFLGLFNLATCRSAALNITGKYASIAFIVATAITMNINFCLNLWKDNFRQQAIFHNITTNMATYNAASTIVFDEMLSKSLYRGRRVWGYEYTGYLIRATHEKKHFGVSPKELLTLCAIKDDLFSSDEYRRRYNLGDYKIYGGQLKVKIREVKTRIPFRVLATLKMVCNYYFSKDLYESKLKKRYLFSFHHSSYCQSENSQELRTCGAGAGHGK